MSDEDHYDPNFPPRRSGPKHPVKAQEFFEPVLSKLWGHFDDPAYQEKMRMAENEKNVAELAIAQRTREPKLLGRGVPADIAHIIATDAMDTNLPCVVILRSTVQPALVLSGPTGVGKTFAAALWIDEGTDTARMVSATQLSMLTKSRIDKNKFEELCRCSVLAIDDLGTEVDDDRGSFRSRFDRLMSRRIAAKKRTVITTNLNAIQFQHPRHGYGDRVWSRLFQHGRFDEVNGVDLRRHARSR